MARLLSPLFAMAFLLAGAVRAQQLPAFHDTLVVTASGEPQALDEVSAATTVIEKDEIEAAGAASLAEVLRLVPGSTLVRSGGDNGVTTLFVRGCNAAHTLVLWDGVRLNSPFFGGYDWSTPLSVGIGRVEVVRGPYSALYGGDALGGVVQLLPLQTRANELRGLLEGGSASWRRAEVEASLHTGRLEVQAGAAQRDGTGALVNDDFSSRTALLGAGTSFAGGSRIALLLRRTTSEAEIPFSGALSTPHRFTATGETIAAVPLHVRLAADTELEAVLSRVERTVAFRDPDDPFGFVASDTAADSDGARTVLHWRWAAHHLMAGAEWRRDRVTDGSSYGMNLDGRSILTRSLFLQDRTELTRGVELLAGARVDEARPWGSEVSPRVTVSWRAQRLRSWASWGRAFRAPALGELYYPLSGNPSLTPERARSGEMGVAVPLGSGALIQVVGFRNRVTDLIDFDYASFRFANISRAFQDGVELSGSAALGAGTSLAVAATYLDARDGDGRALLRRPHWSGSATLRGPLPRGITGEAALVWVGPRVDLDPVSFARVAQGGFLTANAALAFPLAEWLKLRLRGENLANRSYQEVRGYPAPRRRLFAGLEVATR